MLVVLVPVPANEAVGECYMQMGMEMQMQPDEN